MCTALPCMAASAGLPEEAEGPEEQGAVIALEGVVPAEKAQGLALILCREEEPPAQKKAPPGAASNSAKQLALFGKAAYDNTPEPDRSLAAAALRTYHGPEASQHHHGPAQGAADLINQGLGRLSVGVHKCKQLACSMRQARRLLGAHSA